MPKPAKSVRKSRSSAATYVALLRGVNVGGKNRLAMSDLRAMFETAACADVRTYIQSGNVVFTASKDCARAAPDCVGKQLAQTLTKQICVVIRSADQLAKVVAGNPFLKQKADPAALHVAFLENPPRTNASIDPNRSPGDHFELRGQELYLHFPNGVANSKLTSAYLDSTLGTTCTVRNWRTVCQLLEMAQAEQGS